MYDDVAETEYVFFVVPGAGEWGVEADLVDVGRDPGWVREICGQEAYAPGVHGVVEACRVRVVAVAVGGLELQAFLALDQ